MSDRFDIPALLSRLQSYGDAPCLFIDEATFSYNDLISACNQWQDAWSSTDISAGDVIAIAGDFSVSAFGCILAAWSKGAIVALLPGNAAQHDDLMNETLASWSLDLLSSDQPREPIARGKQDSHEILERLKAEQDAGFVIFTSGSSGKPKAVVHQAKHFLSKFEKPGKAYRTVSFLLFDHIAGVDTAFYTFNAGGALAVPTQRDPESICKLIERSKAQVLPASPSFLRLMLLSNAHKAHDISSVEIITYGSEPMDETTLETLAEALPAPKIIQKYGTSEFGAPRAASKDRSSRWMNLKQDEIEHKIIDDILWVKSNNMMLGYLNAPSPFDNEGWYCTGDLVEQDGDWIKILGRQSDMINVGGEKVMPADVESVIAELPFVAEVVVAGEQHALLGQIVAAAINLVEGHGIEKPEKEIRKHCRENLARHMIPVKFDIVKEPLTNARQKKTRSISK